MRPEMVPDDPELAAVIRALTDEPLPPPVTERVPWRGRFRHPRRLLSPWVTQPSGSPPRYGRKGALGKYLKRWLDSEWGDYWRRYPMGGGRDHPGPDRPVVPWPVHADCNKPHKCPACRSYAGVYDQLEQTGGHVRYWRMYTCQNDGQRFARRFYLREHPCDRCRVRDHIRLRLRIARWGLERWWFDWRRRHGLT
jgi:hypothetical protein